MSPYPASSRGVWVGTRSPQSLARAGLRNGDLLRRASGAFDVLVTGDQGLQYQQDLSSVRLGIVVVAGQNNRVETFLALASRILEAIEAVQPGAVIRVTG